MAIKLPQRWRPHPHANSPFAITQPLEEQQRRMKEQRFQLGLYVPNQVSALVRLTLVLAVVAWSAWAATGLMLGRLFVLLSRKGGVEFFGWSAALASVSILCVVALCAVTIADHYDRRDNEQTYRLLRRLAWRSALLFIVGALVVKCAAPGGDSGAAFAGLASSDLLRQWVQPGLLGRWLATLGIVAPLLKFVVFGLWFVLLLALCARFGVIRKDGAIAHWVISPLSIIWICSLSMLWVIDTLAGGLDPALKKELAALTDAEWRRRIAWVWSGLILSVVCLVVVAALTVVLAVRVASHLSLRLRRLARSTNTAK